MTGAARVVAMLAGFVGAVVALVAGVREIVRHVDPSVDWQTAAVLRHLTSEPSRATWIAAAVAAALGVILLVLTLRQFGTPHEGPQFIQFKDDAGWARLDVAAMERGMRRRLQAALPDATVREVQLHKDGEVWRARVAADVPGRDLPALRARMQAMLGDDLLRTGGMQLRRLDLVVTRLGAS